MDVGKEEIAVVVVVVVNVEARGDRVRCKQEIHCGEGSSPKFKQEKRNICI